MWKWLFGIALFALISGYVGYGAYIHYRGGFNTRPDMPPGAFSISFKSGLRAILIDLPDERETRRYFGHPFEVPFYLEDTWAFCSPPRDDEAANVATFMRDRDFPGERFEAVCRIQVDDEVVYRGAITTVPRL